MDKELKELLGATLLRSPDLDVDITEKGHNATDALFYLADCISRLADSNSLLADSNGRLADSNESLAEALESLGQDVYVTSAGRARGQGEGAR